MTDTTPLEALVFANIKLWEEFMLEGKNESLVGYCQRRKDYLIEKLDRILKENEIHEKTSIQKRAAQFQQSSII